jgi:hypothetical protein
MQPGSKEKLSIQYRRWTGEKEFSLCNQLPVWISSYSFDLRINTEVLIDCSFRCKNIFRSSSLFSPEAEAVISPAGF